MTNDDDVSPPGTPADALVERLAADARVLGVAELAPGGDRRLRLLVATTWDGLDPLSDRLPELAALLVSLDDAVVRRAGPRLDALTVDGRRVSIELERMSLLKPEVRGRGAVPLHDPQGLLAQWSEWSTADDRRPTDDAVPRAAEAVAVLGADDGLRALGEIDRGTALLRPRSGPSAFRHKVGNLVRERVRNTPDLGPAVDALRRRAAEVLSAIPPPGEGLRLTGEGASGDDLLEAFLATADREGFAGDRVLFGLAAERLEALAHRPPVFEEGFCLPSFDQVEGRWAIGEAVGGCKPPLVPGVYVGVGVTPADALELWAAPCVREPAASVACVMDDGERTVLARSAGGAALGEALTECVAGAHGELEALIRRCRAAHREALPDPGHALRALHLPRSYVAAAGAHGALRPGVTRLMAALALARAGEDAEPIVARKFALAAGRLLANAPQSAHESR